MKKLLRAIPIGFSIVTILGLIAMVGADFFNYYLEKTFLLPNWVSLLIAILILAAICFGYYRISPKTKLKNKWQKHYWIILLVIFICLFLLQLFILKHIYFYTSWDVKVVLSSADYYLENGALGVWEYTSMYPNNLLLIMLIALIKTVPIIGKSHLFLLAVNALLVNLAGLFAILTVKNLAGKRWSLISLILVVPLLILSPWIIIPYTDTFAVMLPILILYIYSGKKRWCHWLIIGILGSVGYHIKPTVIITLMAIIFIELISLTRKKLQANWHAIVLAIVAALSGIVLGLGINSGASMALGFIQDENYRPFTFTHYLAMGQFDERLGMFNGWDVQDTIDYGDAADSKNIEKFWRRLSARSGKEQAKFWLKKLSLNYNDGTFGWGNEGGFYDKIPENNGRIATLLKNVFYNGGGWHEYYAQTMQLLWMFVLLCSSLVLANYKEYDKTELVAMLSLIVLSTFLMIFEPRTRYMFCYLPVYLVVAIIGLQKVLKLVRHN